MKPKDVLSIFKVTISEWSEDKVARLAAGLAYYTIFSLAPLLVIVIAIVGLIIGRTDAAQSQVMDQIGNLIGQEGRNFVESMIQATSAQKSTGIVATIIGIVTLLLGALGVFGQLQDALNTIWEVAPKPIKGLWGNIRSLLLHRLLSFSMILVIGFLLLVSLVVSAILSALGGYIGSLLPISEIILQTLSFLVSFGIITALFALIFKFLPDAEIAWRDVWLGAAVTSLLFTIGKFLIGLYLGQSNVASSFGAAGSLVILLIWVYYSANILFFGAEFTQVYANTYGSRIQPDENAIPLTEQARAQQGLTRRGALEPVATGVSPALNNGPVLVPTGQDTSQRRDQIETAYPGGYVYRGRMGRKSIFSRIFYGLLLASQFIPSIRSLASKPKSSRLRTPEDPASSKEQAHLKLGESQPAENRGT